MTRRAVLRIYMLLFVIVAGCAPGRVSPRLIDELQSDPAAVTALAQIFANARAEEKARADALQIAQEAAFVRKSMGESVEIPIGDSPALGTPSAKIVVVAFLDFECPYSAAAFFDLVTLGKKYSDSVRLVFKHFPLSSHRQSRLTAIASEIAKGQGKFWPFATAIFHDQVFLSYPFLLEIAGKVGLNIAAFQRTLSRNRLVLAAAVEADRALGKKIGVTIAPTIFVNGFRFEGHLGAEKYEKLFSIVGPSRS